MTLVLTKNRLPLWFRQEIPDNNTAKITRLLSEYNVNTVCQKAMCPNINYCFRNQKLTFMILGDACARNCSFCSVGAVLNLKQNCPQTRDSLRSISEPSLDDEPYRISQLVKLLGLNYVVITSVSRDDLTDGGASQFARTIELIHGLGKNIKVEVLIPDFQGKILSLECVLKASPFILAHNIETVRCLYSELRPQADYQLSLGLLNKAKEIKPEVYTKSSIMLGLGEAKQEVINAMEDLKKNKCDILTLGQYLAPSVNHYAVKEFITVKQFQEYKDIAVALGFKAVLSGPLVRSSYHAKELSEEFLNV